MTSTGRRRWPKAGRGAWGGSPHGNRLALATAGVAVLGATAVGCNLVVGDYSVVGTHWGCVGSVTQPMGNDGGVVALTLEAAPFMMGETLPQVTIRACDQLDDMTCTPAIATATTDSTGEATLTVPSGFQGYLDVTAPDRLESLVYLSWPIAFDTTVRLAVGAYADYTAQVMAATGTVNPMDGAILVNTEDCFGQPAAGVDLSLDSTFSPGTDPFYFLDGSAVSAQTQPETSSDAIGGFANVRPGLATLSATLASNGELYGRLPAYVRTQSLTVIWLQPTPL